MVVKAPDDRLRCDAAYVLDGTMDWSVNAEAQNLEGQHSPKRTQ